MAFQHKRKLVIFLVLVFLAIELINHNVLPVRFQEKVKANDVRYLLSTVIHHLERHNVTYWLDYGTALGAYRYCDIIPFDFDGDIGYLNTDFNNITKCVKDLNNVTGMQADTYSVTYKNVHVDLRGWKMVHDTPARWFFPYTEGHSDSAKLFKLHRGVSWIEEMLANIAYEIFPYNYVQQRKRVQFGDICAYIVDKLEDFVKARYPISYRWEVNYGSIEIPRKAPICKQSLCMESGTP